VITAIVYSSFASVAGSVGMTRAAAEELRLRQFLVRSFTTNLTTAYSVPPFDQDIFRFLGTDEDNAEGPSDSLRFSSSAPLMGGISLPGDLKEVRYEILLDEPVEENPEADESAPEQEAVRELKVMETPLLGGNVQEVEEDGRFVADVAYESPSWTVPIRTMDIRYFDGEGWVDEWDSTEMGRIPWCVHVKLNFARTEAQLDADKAEGLDPEENPDLEVVIPIPLGLGVIQDLRTGQEKTEEERGKT
jgi:hypothetical protein